MSDERFRKQDRLHLSSEIERVFTRRCSVSDDLLVVYVAENGLARPRLGVSVSKRVGIAARRNYITRRLREAFRKSRGDLPVGFDILCVARRDAGDPASDVAGSLRTLAIKAVRRAGRTRTARKASADPGQAGS